MASLANRSLQVGAAKLGDSIFDSQWSTLGAACRTADLDCTHGRFVDAGRYAILR